MVESTQRAAVAAAGVAERPKADEPTGGRTGTRRALAAMPTCERAARAGGRACCELRQRMSERTAAPLRCAASRRAPKSTYALRRRGVANRERQQRDIPPIQSPGLDTGGPSTPADSG